MGGECVDMGDESKPEIPNMEPLDEDDMPSDELIDYMKTIIEEGEFVTFEEHNRRREQ